LLGAVDLQLRTAGFSRALRSAKESGMAAAHAPRADEWRRAQRCAYWLDVASRYHVVRARCLHRSLALHRWLRQEGLRSELRIGVRKVGGSVSAHAWVELDGRVVDDRPDSAAAFTPLTSRRWQGWPRTGAEQRILGAHLVAGEASGAEQVKAL
jgi:hypothetical protein